MSFRHGEAVAEPEFWLETRLSRRLLAALPELATGLYLCAVWMWPMWFGRDGVIGAGVMVAMEMPLLLAAIGSRGFFLSDAKGGIALALTCAAIGAMGLWIVLPKWWDLAPMRWLALAMIAAIVGKAIIVWNAQVLPPLFNTLLGFVQLAAFAFCMSVVTDLHALPQLGLTSEAIAALDLPASPDMPLFGEKAGRAWHQAAAGAACYFLLSGIARLAFLVQRRRMRR